MTFDNIVTLLKNLIDVLLVWFVFYYILKNLRKNVKMVLLFKGIIIIIILKIMHRYLIYLNVLLYPSSYYAFHMEDHL